MLVTSDIIMAILTGAASGLIAWGAIRVEIKYLRRDVDATTKKISHLEDLIHARRRIEKDNHT